MTLSHYRKLWYFQSIVVYSLTLFLVVFFSCKNAEILSNEESNVMSFVERHKSEIPKFSRKKIATYPRTYQKAILAELTPNRKKELWQEKVNYILELKLTIEEKQYLKWYAEKFKSFDYTTTTTTPVNLEKKMYERTIKGMKKFGWTKKFVYQMFFSLGNVDFDKKIKVENQSSRIGYGDRNCDCMYDFGCGGLDPRADCDKSISCDTANGDCGFFGNSECTGDCSNTNPNDL